MAQHDYIISNQTFPNTRADINNLASAIATNNSGTSAPTTQYAGQFWIDTTTTTWTLYIHDGTDDIPFCTIDTSANTVNFTDSALDVVTDTTPQLGGDLDLNSNDITGTGNINITGNATVSGNLIVDTNTLYVDSANNRVGIGTSSPSSFGNANNRGITINGQGTAGFVEFQSSGTAYGAVFANSNNAGISSITALPLTFETNTTERMRIDSSGSVGIGTSTISGVAKVVIDGEETNNGYDVGLILKTNASNTSSPYLALGDEQAVALRGIHTGTWGRKALGFYTSDNTGTSAFDPQERMRIDSSGNVGIGSTSPSTSLHIQRNTTSGTQSLYPSIHLENLATGTSYAYLQIETNNGATDGGLLAYVDHHELRTNQYLTFRTGSAEAMRIDSSGNVLVGKTSSGVANVGAELRNGSSNYALLGTASSEAPMLLNRTTSDGDIIKFRKDNSAVGSISTQDGLTINIDGGGDRAGIVFVSTAWFPRKNGALVDNTLDLGSGSYRFDDLFATNGTIQTSDQNEKQSIQSLTASEMAVAQRISKLFKTFKWNSAVEEKGDSARTHTGIIAQDVQQAFADEGLDAGDYALFISDTWWEKEISVDAVAEELDEEGNILVEGKDAYTYLDTKEEATEGYTERTRLGIRYPELLSFVSSAFEQRLTNIETRLTALET